LQADQDNRLTVLLLGAGGNAGLNYAKSLALAPGGYRLVACDLDAYNLAACSAEAKYLLPRLDDAAKIDALNRIIAKERVDFVHAQPDPEVRFLVDCAPRLQARTFAHDPVSFRRFADKLACQAAWQRAFDLDFLCASLSEVRAVPERFEALRARSGKVWVRAIAGAGSRAALPVERLDQAQHWADYWIATRGMREQDFMLAEFLSGDEYAVQTFWAEGELLHAQARKRLVYFFGSIMPSGQSSTPAVAVTVTDRDVYDGAYAAIRCVDPRPHGIYCVDLKRNAAGAVIPMEVNYGRFFTTSDFFARLGINTPHAVIRYALFGEREHRIESAKAGWYWLRGLDREPLLTDDPHAGFAAPA
jgi:carbamoyl-phosphate synthase large subunit